MFPTMADIVPAGVAGIAETEHFDVSERDSMMTAIRGAMDYVPAGKYVKLKVNGCLYMSDTRMEKLTNREVVRCAKGNVLIAGLGIGMILHPILAKPEVSHVTVVEKFPDVIALVGPTVQHKNLTIVEGDIYTWRPARVTKYDTIYFDIWADQSTDDLEDMKQLHLAFRGYKAKGAWMNSWRRDWLRAEKRRQSRYSW